MVESMRNVQIRIDQHSNTSNYSEPARHLRENPSHSSSSRILCTTKYFYKRRILEKKTTQMRPNQLRAILTFLITPTTTW